MPWLAAAGPLATSLGSFATSGLGGTLLSGLGGLFLNRGQERAFQDAAGQSQIQPFSLQGDLGGINATQSGATVNATPQQQALMALLQGQAGSDFLGPGAGIEQQALGAAGPQLAGLFQQSQNALGNIPTQAFDQTAGLLGSLSGAASQGGLGALGAGLSGLNPAATQSQGLGFLGQAQQGFQNAGNVQGLVDDRLSALRQAAAPQEEQALNSLQQRLFSQGRLGSTGGSRDFEAFGRGLGQADLQRQVQAQDLGLQTSSLLGNLASQQGGLGQGLLRSGLWASGQLANQGQGLLGLGGNLGLQGLGVQAGLSDLVASRGQQRLANAQNLLGFGQQFRTGEVSRGLDALTGTRQITDPLQNLLQASGMFTNIGTNAAQTRARILGEGAGSSGGGLLGGIGDVLGGIGGLFS